MENLAQTAQLLEASTKLRVAAYWLDRLAEDAPCAPDVRGKEALLWSGRFLPEVDWTSHHTVRGGTGGEFAVQATSVRPVFFSSLAKLGNELRRAGVKDEKQLYVFLVELYRLLTSDRSNRRPRMDLRLVASLGAEFLTQISQSILVALGNNGLPPIGRTLWEDTRVARQDLAWAAATSH